MWNVEIIFISSKPKIQYRELKTVRKLKGPSKVSSLESEKKANTNGEGRRVLGGTVDRMDK